jgi:hypothetical protein
MYIFGGFTDQPPATVRVSGSNPNARLTATGAMLSELYMLDWEQRRWVALHDRYQLGNGNGNSRVDQQMLARKGASMVLHRSRYCFYVEH